MQDVGITGPNWDASFSDTAGPGKLEHQDAEGEGLRHGNMHQERGDAIVLLHGKAVAFPLTQVALPFARGAIEARLADDHPARRVIVHRDLQVDWARRRRLGYRLEDPRVLKPIHHLASEDESARSCQPATRRH